MLHLGVLQFSLDIPYAESLKDKRSVLNALRDRLRRHYNVSISQTDDLDECTYATMGAVMAGSDIRYINSAMDKLINTLRDLRDASLSDHQLEIFTPEL